MQDAARMQWVVNLLFASKQVRKYTGEDHYDDDTANDSDDDNIANQEDDNG